MKFFKLLGLLLLLFSSPAHADTEVHQNEFHVFFESYATNPAFTQIIQYARLQRQIPKIIAWHRFPNRDSVVNLNDFNTEEINIPAKEGLWSLATERVLEATLQKMNQYPELKLVLHVNLIKMDVVIRPFLDKIPKNRIQMIHLYEDGYGILFKDALYKKENQKIYSPQEVQEGILDPQKWEKDMIYSLHKVYPVTYHLFGLKYLLKDPKYESVKDYFKGAIVQDVDFDLLARELTDSQKRIIYKLAGFDYDYFYQLMHNKKSIVFTMGYYFENEEKKASERNFLKKLQTDEVFSGIRADEYIWLYKPHPSYMAADTIDVIRQQNKDMIEIPAQVPFEVFILAGLKPTYTVGFSSSLFYVLEDKDILYFIRRIDTDNYLNFLTEIRHLNPKKILDLTDFRSEVI